MASLCWSGNSSLHQIHDGLRALRHRGPDGTGAWRSPGGHVSLGHTRLSVVDLATGNQPLTNETGHIHAVVNGEFYDFEDIRADLESRGHRFSTKSDSEILLHLYEESGAGCTEYLNGEYAFILWDDRAKLLFAARDRFGIKPLFFSVSRGGVVFASEVKALHAAGVAPGWDEKGYFEKLVLDAPLEGRTLFDNISELPPAHYLIARDGDLRTNRYWDFNYLKQSELPGPYSDDEHADRLQTVLENAVRRRLRGDVPVACCLSGGIDSSSVFGLMSRHVNRQVDTFCLAFEDPAYDESTVALRTASELNGRIQMVPVTQAALAANFTDAVWHSETVFANAQVVAKFLLSAAVQQAGYKVVLTGEGADEIFAGYPAFVMDALRNPGFAAPQGFQSFLDRLGYVPAWYQAREVFLGPLRDVLPGRFQSEALHQRLLDSLDYGNQLHQRSIVDQSLYLYNRTSLHGHILTALGDRMEMAHSVEGRLPFLDRDVVEFSRRLPSDQKIRGCAEKFVLRKAMRGVVPPEICGRRKQALSTPPLLLQPGPMHELMQDTLRGSSMDSIPFLDKAAVVRKIDQALKADEAQKTLLDGPLMALLSTCLLSDRFRL